MKGKDVMTECAHCTIVQPLEGCGFGCDVLKAAVSRDAD